MASWLTNADVIALTAVALDGHATKLAVNGGQSIVFARWSNYKASQNDPYPYDRTAAQTCLVEILDTQPVIRPGDINPTSTIDGYLERPTPFDVQTGDLFSIGVAPQEQSCIVVYIENPKLGLQRAFFRMRIGEQ